MSHSKTITYTHIKEMGAERVEVLFDFEKVGEIRAISGWWKYFADDGEDGDLCKSLQESKDALEKIEEDKPCSVCGAPSICPDPYECGTKDNPMDI